MRLQKIKANYFRGFQEDTSAILDSDLVVVYGDNGAGKTSLAEAIEWLLYGSTQRRRISDADEVEFRDALKNVKCPDDEVPYVEAVFEIDSGTQITARRELIDNDGASSLTINGDSVSYSEYIDMERGRHYYPVIVQENLDTIVGASGQDRRKEVSKMLGLDPIMSLEEGFRSAKRKFVGSLPESIRQHVGEFKALRRKLTASDVGEDLVKRWRRDEVEYPDDWGRLLEYAAEVCETEDVNENAVRTKLRTLLDEAVKRAFDYDPYKPVEDHRDQLSDLESHQAEVTGAVATAIRNCASILTARARLLEQVGAVIGADERTLLRKGLEIAPEPSPSEPVECPLCREENLSYERVESIREHLEECEGLEESESALENAIENADDEVENLTSVVEALRPAELNDEDRKTLEEILGKQSDEVDDLFELNGRLKEIEEDIGDKSGKLSALLEELPAPLTQFSDIVELNEQVGSPIDQLSEAVDEFIDTYDSYAETFAAFKTAVLQATTPDERVEKLEKVKQVVDSHEAIRTASVVASVLRDLNDSREAITKFREEQEQELLKARGTDIRKWFRMLYPAERDVVDFAGADPSGTVLRLYARILGVDRHAVSHFSQSQAACLGLALHLTYSVDDECPFDFIVFDDPIQSFDSEHRDAFYTEAIDTLVEEHDKKVVVLTHIESFAEDIFYRNKSSRDPTYFRLQEYDEDGIDFDKKDTLQTAREGIRRKMKRGRSERLDAAKDFSPFTEKMTKALYQATTGQPLPRKYRAQDVPVLLELFSDVEIVDDRECDTLRDNWNFGTKPRHDDPEMSRVPERRELETRIEELESIARRHDVLE